MFYGAYNNDDSILVSKNGLTPLHIAAHYGHVDIAELLLNRGADTDARARVRLSSVNQQVCCENLAWSCAELSCTKQKQGDIHSFYEK